jgi:hypothetical protein
MLLTIVGALFMIARADVAKVQAATDARAQTWQQRPNAPPGQLLAAWHNPADSQVSTLPQRPVDGGPVFTGLIWQAQSGNALIGNPWASRAIPFPSQPNKNIKIHTSVLTPSVASRIGAATSSAALDTLSWTMDPGANTALVTVAKACTAPVVGGNALVWVAGFYLEVTAGAPIKAQITVLNKMWDALEISTVGLAGLTKQGKKIKDALNKITNALNCFDNLWEAANGRLGADLFNN